MIYKKFVSSSTSFKPRTIAQFQAQFRMPNTTTWATTQAFQPLVETFGSSPNIRMLTLEETYASPRPIVTQVSQVSVNSPSGSANIGLMYVTSSILPNPLMHLI